MNSPQRRAARFKAHNLISVHGQKETPGVLSNLVDISSSGAGFISKVRHQVGDELILHLKIPVTSGKLKNVEVKAKVAWIKPIEARQEQLTGAFFVDMTEDTAAQIKPLLVEHRRRGRLKGVSFHHRTIFGPVYWLQLLAAGSFARIVIAVGLLCTMPVIFPGLGFMRNAAEWLSAFENTKLAHGWPPGMSLALYGFFYIFEAHIWGARLLSFLLAMLTVVMVALIARSIFEKSEESKPVGWLAALYPPAILLSNQPHSHHLAGLGVLAFAFLFKSACDRKSLPGFLWAGLVWGLTIITQPAAALFFFPVLWLCKVTNQRSLSSEIASDRATPAQSNGEAGSGFLPGFRRVIQISVLCLAAGAVVFPIVGANDGLGNMGSVLVPAQRELFIGNNEQTPLYKTWYLKEQRTQKTNETAQVYFERIFKKVDAEKKLGAEALKNIVHSPITFVIRTLSRLRAFWGFDYYMAVQLRDHCKPAEFWTMLLFEAGGYGLAMLFILAGLLLYPNALSRDWKFWLLGLTVSYQAAYLFTTASGNDHFPIVWILMPFAGPVLGRLMNSAGRSELLTKLKSRLGLVIGVLGIFLVLQLEYAYQLVKFSNS